MKNRDLTSPCTATAAFCLCLLTLALSTSPVQTYVRAEEPSCRTPPIRESTNGASWPRGSQVRVTINPTYFPVGSPQFEAIKLAFTNWQNGNGVDGSNSGVTFTFTSGVVNTVGTKNQIYVTKGDTDTGAYNRTSFSGVTTLNADIIIDTTVTRADTKTGMVAHEIGETFGLGDCPNCPSGSSVMGPPTCIGSCSDFNNRVLGTSRPGLQGPTPCDNSKLKEISYQQSMGECVRQTCSSTEFWNWDICDCQTKYSPVIIDVLNDGFNLTSKANGSSSISTLTAQVRVYPGRPEIPMTPGSLSTATATP